MDRESRQRSTYTSDGLCPGWSNSAAERASAGFGPAAGFPVVLQAELVMGQAFRRPGQTPPASSTSNNRTGRARPFTRTKSTSRATMASPAAASVSSPVRAPTELYRSRLPAGWRCWTVSPITV